jgi:hypothetical protein
VVTPVLAVPEGIEKLAWLADGSVLVGSGNKLLRASAASPEWREVASFEGLIAGTITRVVVGAGRIALVVRAP